MDIYLPIAGISVNALVIVAMGLGVGFLSGMFGVGGGFLTTPLLIFYGIPPAVAVASSATQITGASVSGAMAHWRRGGIDMRMGGVLIAGGVVGSVAGSFLFRALVRLGQTEVVVPVSYVLILSIVGGLMLSESSRALLRSRAGLKPPRRRRHHPLVAALPWRMRFYRSGLYISPLAPLALGFVVGVLTTLGVGGGFVMVPAMIYMLGMATAMVVGTSLFQILFVTAVTTVMQAVNVGTVDIVLAVLLLLGSVVGAQFGVRAAQKLSGEWLRLALAVILLLVAGRLLIGLTWRPAELFAVYGA